MQENATIAALSCRLFLQLIQARPEIVVATIRVMGDRLRHFNALIEDLPLRRVISDEELPRRKWRQSSDVTGDGVVIADPERPNWMIEEG